MRKIWRLIDSAPENIYTNMAIDEAIMSGGKLPTLRFYRWKNFCISFGFGERIHSILNNFSIKEFVRRPTGGGIVIHGGDLAYSVTVHEDNPFLPKGLLEFYRNIHTCMIEALGILGIKGQHYLEKSSESRLCFASPSQYDILVDGRKVAGGAQRRKDGVVLYQGSMVIDLDREAVKKGFEKALGIRIVPGKLTNSELANARTLCQTKYMTKKWNYLR